MGLCQAGSSSLLRCHECQCLPLSTASCSASGSAGLGALKRSPENWGACSPCHLHSSVGPAAWGTLAVENPQTILPCTACCCHTWHALTARCYWHQELAPGRSAELKSPWTSANEQTLPHITHMQENCRNCTCVMTCSKTQVFGHPVRLHLLAGKQPMRKCTLSS